jgi:hypothetical protein
MHRGAFLLPHKEYRYIKKVANRLPNLFSKGRYDNLPHLAVPGCYP